MRRARRLDESLWKAPRKRCRRVLTDRIRGIGASHSSFVLGLLNFAASSAKTFVCIQPAVRDSRDARVLTLHVERTTSNEDIPHPSSSRTTSVHIVKVKVTLSRLRGGAGRGGAYNFTSECARSQAT